MSYYCFTLGGLTKTFQQKPFLCLEQMTSSASAFVFGTNFGRFQRKVRPTLQRMVADKNKFKAICFNLRTKRSFCCLKERLALDNNSTFKCNQTSYLPSVGVGKVFSLCLILQGRGFILAQKSPLPTYYFSSQYSVIKRIMNKKKQA